MVSTFFRRLCPFFGWGHHTLLDAVIHQYTDTPQPSIVLIPHPYSRLRFLPLFSFALLVSYYNN